MTTWTMLRRGAGYALLLPSLLLGVGFIGGCGALDVSDPTRVEDQDLANASGADLLRRDALKKFYAAVGQGALWSGLLVDEFLSDPPPDYALYGLTSPEEVLDRRQSLRFEELPPDVYTSWNQARIAAMVAMPKLRAYAPVSAPLGEMFALRGFATLRLAEDFCPGLPLNDVVDYNPVYSPPLATDEVFERALADFDSALVYGADSARVVTFARAGRARTLLGLGRFDEAAATAALVPTDYEAQGEYTSSADIFKNPLAFAWDYYLSRSVADQEGGTGLDFLTAADPRVQTDSLRTADDGTVIYGMAKYPDFDAPIVLASGIEARLIEAEAVLKAGQPTWIGILNALRTTCPDAATCPNPAPAGSGGVEGLPPLTDPGAEAAQLELLFRERAFWLFGTGHRLGDLRRLISRYGRTSESVFPTGPYRLGGVYETATSIPFPATLETPHNPAVTGCTTR